MDRTDEYRTVVRWSDDDAAFIAEVPELPGCAAHGETYEAALASVREAIDLRLDTATEPGDLAPEPTGRRPEEPR